MKNKCEWDLTKTETFSQVFHLTHIQVFHYLYGLTSCPLNDVEDLLAETFIRAWQSRKQFHGDENNVLFWLLRIARNLVFDAYRRKKVRGIHCSLEKEVETISDLSPGPEQTVIDGEKRKVIWNLFQNLSEEVREILALRYFLNWRIKQISSYTMKTETAVSMTIYRAIRSLREDYIKIELKKEGKNCDAERTCPPIE